MEQTTCIWWHILLLGVRKFASSLLLRLWLFGTSFIDGCIHHFARHPRLVVVSRAVATTRRNLHSNRLENEGFFVSRSHPFVVCRSYPPARPTWFRFRSRRLAASNSRPALPIPSHESRASGLTASASKASARCFVHAVYSRRSATTFTSFVTIALQRSPVSFEPVSQERLRCLRRRGTAVRRLFRCTRRSSRWRTSEGR
mmetsp:Transcript_7810/g.48427  ORF Transcript_7810/g.48427 Transcript_7810/m.48427 type:complete len:200 (+) Transcript_7810:1830-2429(+)